MCVTWPNFSLFLVRFILQHIISLQYLAVIWFGVYFLDETVHWISKCVLHSILGWQTLCNTPYCLTHPNRHSNEINYVHKLYSDFRLSLGHGCQTLNNDLFKNRFFLFKALPCNATVHSLLNGMVCGVCGSTRTPQWHRLIMNRRQTGSSI